MRKHTLLSVRWTSLIVCTLFLYSCSKSDHLPGNASGPTRLAKIVFDSSSVNMASIQFSYNSNSFINHTRFNNINNGVTADFDVQYLPSGQLRYVNSNEPREYDLYQVRPDMLPATREMSVMSFTGEYVTFLYAYKYKNGTDKLDSVIITQKNTGAIVGWYQFEYNTNGNITRITQPSGNSTWSTEITYDENPNYYRNTNPLLHVFLHNLIDTETNFFAYFFSSNNPRTFKQTGLNNSEVTLNLTPTSDKKVSEYNYNGHVEYKTSFHYEFF